MESYRQTTQYTGASAALLMALHHYTPEEYPLTREKEFSIWMRSANLPTRSSSIYALACVANESGVTARVIVGEKEYDYPDYRFKRYKKLDIDHAKYSSKLHARRAREQKIPIEEHEFTLEDVKKQLAKRRLVILRVNAGILRDRKATSRYILITGHDDGYAVQDPDQGALKIPDDAMERAFETLVTRKKRDHRMLVLGD